AQEALGGGGGSPFLPRNADEPAPGRASERPRPPLLASSTLQHPLQAVGGQRPPAGDRKLLLAHAAPPRWRRTDLRLGNFENSLLRSERALAPVGQTKSRAGLTVARP